ncbi:unnamed protein product [Prorocentrum cordatum]|uniref:Uncharacterized protein n=1 Tax=Prorocentrum cordatum TaxID=2364126 RepID=A0ABN9UUN4_9DINO|nr:unnamed protein product [Polarella glacialis]
MLKLISEPTCDKTGKCGAMGPPLTILGIVSKVIRFSLLPNTLILPLTSMRFVEQCRDKYIIYSQDVSIGFWVYCWLLADLVTMIILYVVAKTVLGGQALSKMWYRCYKTISIFTTLIALNLFFFDLICCFKLRSTDRDGGGTRDNLPIPIFDGTGWWDFSRHVEAWQLAASLKRERRGPALDAGPRDDAWAAVEDINLERFAELGGLEFLMLELKDRFEEQEILRQGDALYEFFVLRTRRQQEQTRTFMRRFNALVRRLAKFAATLPPIVLGCGQHQTARAELGEQPDTMSEHLLDLGDDEYHAVDKFRAKFTRAKFKTKDMRKRVGLAIYDSGFTRCVIGYNVPELRAATLRRCARASRRRQVAEKERCRPAAKQRGVRDGPRSGTFSFPKELGAPPVPVQDEGQKRIAYESEQKHRID